MLDLTVIDRAFLKQQGDARTIRTMVLPAYRGMITDRNGEPLAVSTPVDSIWINPQDFDVQDQDIPQLAKLLNLPVNSIKALAKEQKKGFIYLKRGVEPALANQIKELDISGVYLQHEFHRYYPEGEVASHLIGFTNIDDKGQEGIELAYNDWLQGSPGKKRVIQDRMGHIVEEVAKLQDPRPGQNIVLSIDRRIQYIAHRELKKAIEQHHAASGSIVVLDTVTGEVLGMVNYPTYDPNVRHQARTENYRNRAVTDVFEPGSVMKAFSIATALESGKYSPNTVVDTRPGSMMVGDNEVRDVHPVGVVDLTGVLKHSSNVGTAKVILSLPKTDLVNFLHRLGFGNLTGSDFPGESPGVLQTNVTWGPFVQATLAFGYSISATPLQLARAYTVFATGGKLLPVSLLKVNAPVQGVPVLKPKAAKQMLTMLEAVMESGGSGAAGQMEGYRAAGKTGTARVATRGGYDPHRHIASFIGLAPVTRPRLIVAIVIVDPKKSYYSAQVAAPIFSQVMNDSLRILEVPPDNVALVEKQKEV
ncbi:MAG: penicillin-binding protein 2 [Proteobacteria bacterium]|nr:penicillin-binding protein 2 [Pseudomonadota bacterium]